MIIANGAIKFKLKADGGMDADGYPVTAAPKWSEPFPCQYITNTSNLRGVSNGEHFATASYIVYVDLQRLPDSEQVELADAKDGIIGEFPMLAAPEVLQAVQQLRLTLGWG